MHHQPPLGSSQQLFSLYETLEATYYAIAWKDDAKCLVSFAVLPATLLLILLSKPTRTSSGSSTPALLVLALSGILILCAQPLNTWLHHNWRTVVSQNYFDDNGVFMSIFWSGPLLVVFAVASMYVMKDVFRSLQVPHRTSRPSSQNPDSQRTEAPKSNR